MKPSKPSRADTVPRHPGRGEEFANAFSHGTAMLLAVAALPILVHRAAVAGGAADVTAVSLFAGSAVLLYFISTLYHAMPPGRPKDWLRRFDHAAIYLFIAGSYMPFALGALRGPWGWSLFGVVTGLAVIGVTAKLLDRLRHPVASLSLYLAMGWLAILVWPHLAERLPGAALAWLVAGGAAYTVGTIAFALDERLRWAHFVWHLFVLGGSACHFFAVLTTLDAMA